MKISTILLIFLCFSPVLIAASTDTLKMNDFLIINQTLISAGTKFEMGFFNKGNPKRYYIGIWYKDIPSDDISIWVANRDAPLLDESGRLKVGNDSNLVLLNGGDSVVWKSPPSKGVNPVLQLLDTGNLVIRESGDLNPDHYIWQSFDNPTDSLIPGQKLTLQFKTGLEQFLTSWSGPDDPGTGNYTLKLDSQGDSEIYVRYGNEITYRSGPWVGQRFSGLPEMKSGDEGINFSFVSTSTEVYYMFESSPDSTIKSRLKLTYDGIAQRWAWVPQSNKWSQFWYAPEDVCDTYGKCGPYAVCNTSALFACQCPHGFKPMNPQAWALRDGTDGCIWNTSPDCLSDWFLTVSNVKLPETTSTSVNATLNLDQCRNLCIIDCSCTGYASSTYIKGVGSGCIIWTDSLIDMRDYVDGGQPFYLRLDASDLGDNHKVKIIVGVTVASGTATVIALVLVYFYCRKKAKQAERNKTWLDILEDSQNLDKFEELPLFKFGELVVATNNFDECNKLGRGGFGTVYKGTLENGMDVAIKRLSGTSRQGVEEFMNEVLVISRLQHRNLVKLLGCCVERHERLLVYEYMPNKSLDAFLFDTQKKAILDWKKRFNIIEGICRGLLYLHRDSRLKIIHRDLKASNILLDQKLNPKISDFGMARIFGGDQNQGDTTRVAGTYGYMPPEYAIEGRFSEKSDVFSFGVLLLEIITGKRAQWYDEESSNLLGYVWKQWSEDNVISLIDPEIPYHGSEAETLKCIHVGLLCVQKYADDRPDVSSVISMLTAASTAHFRQPKPPGFTRLLRSSANTSSQSHHTSSKNELSITDIGGR